MCRVPCAMCRVPCAVCGQAPRLSRVPQRGGKPPTRALAFSALLLLSVGVPLAAVRSRDRGRPALPKLLVNVAAALRCVSAAQRVTGPVGCEVQHFNIAVVICEAGLTPVFEPMLLAPGDFFQSVDNDSNARRTAAAIAISVQRLVDIRQAGKRERGLDTTE